MSKSSSTSPRKRGGEISAVFVHAGAGFHSTSNEGLHLRACEDATRAAMAFLHNGGTAADAVEHAIRVMEDRSITNSGYGSNLTLDGVVECDATIVDHYGRSGAVGAVSQVQNPISVARLVLEHSTKPLSLKRVPPNLLVGQGATDFAYEHGIPLVPHDAMVTPSARERWFKWRVDLRKAHFDEELDDSEGTDQDTEQDLDYEALVRLQQRRDHTRAMAAGTLEMTPSPSVKAMSPTSSEIRHPLAVSVADTPQTPGSPGGMSHEPSLGSSPRARSGLRESRHSDQAYFHNQGRDGTTSTLRGSNVDEDISGFDDGTYILQTQERGSIGNEGFSDSDSWKNDSDSTTNTMQLPSASPSPPPFAALHTRLPPSPPEGTTETLSPPLHTPLGHVSDAPPLPPQDSLYPRMASLNITDTTEDIKERADLIMDTVGAIAIDCYGNIAAGSSSGGIGMKHHGRTGPAALVGVGTAIAPIDPNDKRKTCVGVVTSGTGEHMATTMAAGVCADRLYSSVRKMNGGGLEEVSEDHCIRGVIEKDFMAHPSVKNSESSGAIGILAVKKTRDGICMYFAHNTDSFAVASMHSDEKVPKCTMSRSVGNGIVAQGGRPIKYHRKR
ncbi:MAG: hypothetical protein M1812_002012 [Candelaria pacifica]|nr:MAG: hypothetical protein M1812_002012 [Candelaria pacifica]